MRASALSQIWGFMATFLPAPLNTIVLALLTACVIYLVARIIKLVLDAIPFI